MPAGGTQGCQVLSNGHASNAKRIQKIQEAVERYRFNDADENSLTGALGQALSTPQAKVVTANKDAVLSFAIGSYKILGTGPGTPERRTGADGIIQISVESDGAPLLAKDLPFHAKKQSRYREAEVAPQVPKGRFGKWQIYQILWFKPAAGDGQWRR